MHVVLGAPKLESTVSNERRPEAPSAADGPFERALESGERLSMRPSTERHIDPERSKASANRARGNLRNSATAPQAGNAVVAGPSPDAVTVAGLSTLQLMDNWSAVAGTRSGFVANDPPNESSPCGRTAGKQNAISRDALSGHEIAFAGVPKRSPPFRISKSGGADDRSCGPAFASKLKPGAPDVREFERRHELNPFRQPDPDASRGEMRSDVTHGAPVGQLASLSHGAEECPATPRSGESHNGVDAEPAVVSEGKGAAHVDVSKLLAPERPEHVLFRAARPERLRVVLQSETIGDVGVAISMNGDKAMVGIVASSLAAGLTEGEHRALESRLRQSMGMGVEMSVTVHGQVHESPEAPSPGRQDHPSTPQSFEGDARTARGQRNQVASRGDGEPSAEPRKPTQANRHAVRHLVL